MLYPTPLKAPVSVLEIFTTSRRSIWGCWSVLGMCIVPCQTPTMSVGEAGVDGCVAAAGATACGAGAAACALTQTPLAASSKAIAPAAQHGNQNSAFPQSRNLRPIRPILIAENTF